ncbi:hypothetical protein IGI04_011080 [Brassica rapa subsp. trilocularis]|uniref:Uncharacterized protein n=1 Tax=Brassica rapa subsp. trilocularis TaxID=1813537 RepID=A0ABQ7N465_BRACM|nr:hypothetical protein IGI04_011080 [Brassica rapa subsp. trilocularis]
MANSSIVFADLGSKKHETLPPTTHSDLIIVINFYVIPGRKLRCLTLQRRMKIPYRMVLALKRRNPRKFCLACDSTAWRPSSVTTTGMPEMSEVLDSWWNDEERSVSAGRCKNKTLASHNNCNVSIIPARAMLCRRRLQKNR